VSTVSRASKGALAGVIVWTAYGLVEYAVDAAGAATSGSGWVVPDWYWGVAGIVALVYAAAGAMLGACGGLLLVRNERAGRGLEAYLGPAVASLVLVQLLSVLAGFESTATYWSAALVTGALLAIAGLGTRRPERKLAHLLAADPWAVSAVLLGVPVLVQTAGEMNRPGMTAVLSAGFLLALAALAGAQVLLRRIVKPVLTRQFLLLFAGAAFVAVTLQLADAPQPRVPASKAAGGSGKPNVVLIVMDTVRAANMSLHGYERETTPNLEALAGGATLYENAITTSDMTLPGHASLFTGLYANAHHSYCDPPEAPWGWPLAGDHRTLAEALSENGYLTAGISANFGIVRPVFGLAQGFDHFDSRRPLALRHRSSVALRRRVRNLLYSVFGHRDVHRVSLTAAEINRLSLPWLRRAAELDRPLFLFMNYMDAHSPYLPPAPYDTLFPGKSPRFSPGYAQRLAKTVMSLQRPITPAEREHLLSQYDGAIAYVDSRIAVVVEDLKRLGMYENTLLIVTSDHGEGLGEKDRMLHPASTAQTQVHVPLLVKYPNQRSAESVRAPVSLIDLMPTVLASVGLDVPESLPGRDMRSIAPGDMTPVFTQYYPCSRRYNWHPRVKFRERAVVAGPYKYIAAYDSGPQCYNLHTDPEEKVNIYNSEPACPVLMDRLAQWYASESSTPSEAITPDAETMKRLRSLGYVQ